MYMLFSNRQCYAKFWGANNYAGLVTREHREQGVQGVLRGVQPVIVILVVSLDRNTSKFHHLLFSILFNI